MTNPGYVDYGTHTATDWAREHGEAFRWYCQLDNYEPPRNYAYGDCYRYSTDTVADAFVIDGIADLKAATDSMFLLDDGHTVRPMYVAGWARDAAYLMVHPMPVNWNDDGTPRMRPDGRQVDFSHWALGPSRAYHLKIHAAKPDDDA